MDPAFDVCTPRTDKGEAKKPVILFDNYEQFLGLLRKLRTPSNNYGG